MIANSKAYWREIAERADWKQYILPRKDEKDFDIEGLMEAHRLYYFFTDKSTVIDYGCGVGRVLQFVAQRAGRSIGLDITESFLKRARIAVPVAEIYHVDQFEETKIADLVYCLMVLQHNDLDSRNAIVSHIYRLLKKGGTAVISFPASESTYYEENEHLHKFTLEEAALFGRPFRSHRIFSGNLPGYAAEVTGFNEHFMVAVK